MVKHFGFTKVAVAALAALSVTGTAQAALSFDLNGAGTVISVDAFDWGPTSVLAQGANQALQTWENTFATPIPGLDPTGAVNALLNTGSTCANSACNFDILTHARLIGFKNGNSSLSLPGGFTGEITMVARLTETVTYSFGTDAKFKTTGIGWLELYYDANPDSSDLTGSGFNNGRLIARFDGTGAASGQFTVTSTTPEILDQSPNPAPGSDNYDGQLTLPGNGSHGNVSFGSTSTVLDPLFFLTKIPDFSIIFAQIGVGLPFVSANPSDCFNNTANANAVGSTGNTSTCNTSHQNADYAGQAGDTPTGYLPVVGDVNIFSGPDFVAQADYNSPVTGTVPEPTGIALFGLALAGLAGATRVNRRRTR